ncbi:MAG: iron-containing alcohol dehydrogenase, partial [Barnesiella sp.]|nr:iron-containing alcohol dehydrogenase [Barnesiella sp.]
MDNFTYCTPTKYVFGRDAELHAGRELREHSITNVMVVYGGGSAVRSGLLDRVLKSLDAEGIA